ncbi:MAG TPA: Mov34/MPN/PAD-1 family protein, partial [Thermoanaerobaculia bacterium]|nr:Mov34/MPN/PAD-1 family protein [Thermoanaerobaculia bacterium]
ALLEELAAMTLLATSRVNHTEAAAFLVHRDGKLSLVPWPDQFERHRQTWQGRVPPGALAVVHTHPDRRPALSEADRALARSTGIAVVALSRWAIWIAEPDETEPVPLVVRRNWTESAARDGTL